MSTRPRKDPERADALQYNLFGGPPTYAGRAAISPDIAPEPAPVVAKEMTQQATPKTQAAMPSAVPGTGGKAQPGDWVRLGSGDRFARDFGYIGGIVDAVVDSRWPLPGLLLTYGERNGRQTRLLGGFRTPHAYANIAEVWRKAPDGTWSQL